MAGSESGLCGPILFSVIKHWLRKGYIHLKNGFQFKILHQGHVFTSPEQTSSDSKRKKNL